MYSNLQKQILNQINTMQGNSKASIKDNVIEAINMLSQSTGVAYTTAEDSNIYILVNFFLNMLQQKKLEYLNFLSNLYEIFDTERFTGYIASNYVGFRAGMLSIDIIDDCKLLTKENNNLQIILYSKNNVDLTTAENKFKIATKIHEYNPLSITYSDAGAISQSITASTGQAITYNYYVVAPRTFNILVKFALDYEDNVTSLNYKTKISEGINQIYSTLYNKIGKDFSVKDFYSITSIVLGITSVSIVVMEGETEYIDKDIPLEITEIFVLGNIDVEQTN